MSAGVIAQSERDTYPSCPWAWRRGNVVNRATDEKTKSKRCNLFSKLWTRSKNAERQAMPFNGSLLSEERWSETCRRSTVAVFVCRTRDAGKTRERAGTGEQGERVLGMLQGLGGFGRRGQGCCQASRRVPVEGWEEQRRSCRPEAECE